MLCPALRSKLEEQAQAESQQQRRVLAGGLNCSLPEARAPSNPTHAAPTAFGTVGRPQNHLALAPAPSLAARPRGSEAQSAHVSSRCKQWDFSNACRRAGAVGSPIPTRPAKPQPYIRALPDQLGCAPHLAKEHTAVKINTEGSESPSRPERMRSAFQEVMKPREWKMHVTWRRAGCTQALRAGCGEGAPASGTAPNPAI